MEFGMNDHRLILKTLPEKPARSRLAPFKKLIMGLLARRRTYREIARILAEKCGMKVSISTLHDFVRLRLGPKGKALSIRAAEQNRNPDSKIATVLVAGKERAQKTHPRAEEVLRRIAELKQRPVSDAKPADVFHYDPGKPLVLSTDKKSKDTEN
jgi:hypothetical protein